MVHVEIEVIEAEARLFLAELAPRADAHAGSVPAEHRLVRSLVKPEVALLEQLQAVLLIENSSILAVLLTVVASHAHVAVAVETLQKVVELTNEHLLRTEDVGILKVDLVTDNLAALCPHITLAVVRRVMVADVVRTYE